MSKEDNNWKKTLRKGKQKIPPRICIYGSHGIGKSTLASEFPSPIFISTEDGLDSLDVVSFPKATTIIDVVDSIKTLNYLLFCNFLILLFFLLVFITFF